MTVHPCYPGRTRPCGAYTKAPFSTTVGVFCQYVLRARGKRSLVNAALGLTNTCSLMVTPVSTDNGVLNEHTFPVGRNPKNRHMLISWIPRARSCWEQPAPQGCRPSQGYGTRHIASVSVPATHNAVVKSIFADRRYFRAASATNRV